MSTDGYYLAQLLYLSTTNETRTWRIALIITPWNPKHDQDLAKIARQKFRNKWIASISDEGHAELHVLSVKAEDAPVYTVEWAKLFQFADQKQEKQTSDKEDGHNDELIQLTVNLPTSITAKKWSIIPMMKKNTITKDEVDQYEGGDNIPCIEATVIAGEGASCFMAEPVEVHGAKTDLSFNLIQQFTPTDKINTTDHENTDKDKQQDYESVDAKGLQMHMKGGTSLSFTINLPIQLPVTSPEEPAQSRT